MTLSAVRDGLVARLNTISGLRVYEVDPEGALQFPAALVEQGDPFIKYDRIMGAADVSYSFEVLLLLASVQGEQAWASLEPYLNATGGSSVKAAVDGNLGGNADWARVVRVEKAGRVTYNRRFYWGATLQVEVYESG
ncbi:MAG: hypothetical protein O2909_11920 [Chloroflexi bacterium]|nr:hypothetical protein [Chloroflexota bacterium]MDA1220126.1 hypothetical protein [Chloroflexota bacterium]PKB58055.1 MAG: hypothetical protein BZY73_00205 [SAR202 cluster bacterium Casp-Chloro-G3]